MARPDVGALAEAVLDRIVEVGTAVLARCEDLVPGGRDVPQQVVATARQVATVIVGATAPFAPTAYSRARLIRQMHASGLLADEQYRPAPRPRPGAGAGGAPR